MFTKSISRLTPESKPMESNNISPIKEGYIIKLKSKKKRYFVLYPETDTSFGRLDYYENEKKFKTNPASRRRSIVLKDCFAVIQKNDPRFKESNIFVFAIYTRKDCFPLSFEDEQEMNDWFEMVSETHLKSLTKSRPRAINDYDKIWFAVNKNKKSKLRGSFYLCLTEEEIRLYEIKKEKKEKRLSSSSDKSASQTIHEKESSGNDQILANEELTKDDHDLRLLRFPFSLIRSFGHGLNNSLMIETGRSSDIGPGELFFDLKDCETSQYIHSLVAQARAAAKNNFRTRSNSENNRMLNRRNKSTSDKQSSNSNNSTSISHSKTTSSIYQPKNSANSKSSFSLRLKNKLINEKEYSSEYLASPIAYSSVACTLARSRSTSESSTSQIAHFVRAKQGLQNLFKAKKQTIDHSTNHILSNNSIQTIDNDQEEEDSDYYMIPPSSNEQPTTCSIKEEDYLVVDESSFNQSSSPPNNRTFSNASTVQLNTSSKSDNLKSCDFKLVSTTGPLANKLTQQSLIESSQRYLPAQYYSPGNNNSLVELLDTADSNEHVDEYIAVVQGPRISNKLEVISSEPSTSDSSKNSPTKNVEHPYSIEEDEDYIGIDSFSSTTNTATNNQETENFEVNLSPISSASINRVKTFSMSSNNTSNNELNSLGTSPSLMSTTHFTTTPINHCKEEVYKLDKVKSYFNSTEDCGDYIRPVRTYSMGSRQLPSHHRFRTTSHCSAMIKSNTLNGPTLLNNQSLMNHSVKKVQCNHFQTGNNDSITCHFDENLHLKDNRVRAFSMGSHSIAKKDAILRKLRSNKIRQQENTAQKDGTIEDEETSEKCLSTPTLSDKAFTRHRSATFVSSSTASTSSKRTNEDSSEECDIMCTDLDKTPKFENSIAYNQISIKEKFKELTLDSDQMMK